VLFGEDLVFTHLQPHGVDDGKEAASGRPRSQAKYHIGGLLQ
jgi:hypothetical protein